MTNITFDDEMGRLQRALAQCEDMVVRRRRVMDAFLAHAPYPDLPAILSPALRKAGFQPIRQRAVPIVNMSYTENSFSTLVAKMIAGYVVGRDFRGGKRLARRVLRRSKRAESTFTQQLQLSHRGNQGLVKDCFPL
jgi:hypothetical protein